MNKKTGKSDAPRMQQIINELKDKKHLHNEHKPIVDELETLAKKHQDSALKIMQRSGDKSGTSHVLSNIGNIYQRQEDYNLSLDYHQQALEIREDLNDQFGIASSLNNMGICYDMAKDYVRALKSYHKARELYEKAGNLYGLISTLNNIGYVYTEQQKYKDAKKSLSKALSLGEEINNKHHVLETRNAIGIIIAKEKKYEEALSYMLETLKMAEKVGAKPQIKEVLQELYRCEKNRGNYADALNYYERMIILEKEIFNEETARKISNLKMAADLDRKEKETEIERLKNVELKKAYEIIEVEKTKSENLLLNILPFEIAEELKEFGTTKARFFENVTVMFTDFKGFTSLSAKISPQELVDELHSCFTAFDNIINKYKIEKIKTIGDSYMAVCGVPVSSKDHALKMVKAASDILQFILKRQKKQKQKSLDIRIGIHSGSVVAGVVGKNKFAYDIWGDTVNVASRLEQHCEPGKVNISLDTYLLVKDEFNCTSRGKIEVKNKGIVEMFYIQ